MQVGDILKTPECLESQNGFFKLCPKADGELVIESVHGTVSQLRSATPCKFWQTLWCKDSKQSSFQLTVWDFIYSCYY